MRMELLEIILEIKNQEVSREENNNPIDYNKVNELKKEIEYLKAAKVRYEIARILGLDNNTEYLSKDFLGIENEDLSNYHITQDELERCNRLISYLPADQITRYRLRKRLAEVLTENTRDEYGDLEDIENVNPTLPYYGLNQEQINRFNALAEQVNRISRETTKKVNLSKEALNIIKEELVKLDIDDVDQYNSIKESSLELIDKLITGIDDEEKETIFTNITNYELVKDLTLKYPSMNVLLNNIGVDNLLRYIRTTDLEEEDYNSYLDLSANNINKLYEDDANKPMIESIINTIDPNDHILRSDLSSRVNDVENTHLNIENAELTNILTFIQDNYDGLDDRTRQKYSTIVENLVNSNSNVANLRLVMSFLDRNYNRLSEEDKNKYYGVVESAITSNASDLNNINDVNNIMLGVRSRSLSDRLGDRFANSGNIEVQRQHQSGYKTLVDNAIRKLREQRAKYESKKPSTYAMGAYYDTKIKEIDKEIEKLESMQLDYDNKKSIRSLDKSYNKKTDKIIELEKEIKALQELKEQLNSKIHKKVIDRKIKDRQIIIDRLQKSKTRIVGTQKVIMAPKAWLNQQKGGIGRHFEAKQEVYETQAQDFERMAQSERQIGGMFSGVKAAFYEHKASQYHKESERNERICEILRGARVNVKGNNRRLINRNLLDRLRQNQQATVQTM